jgi:hypothetical protein
MRGTWGRPKILELALLGYPTVVVRPASSGRVLA